MPIAATLRAPRLVVAPRPPEDAVDRLSHALGIDRVVAALLVQRGLGDPDSARRFLRPDLKDLSDPFGLAGMQRAVETIVATVRAGRPILVHGDYDVDGQCATALLTRTLQYAGARVEPFVPHRMRDGYDFRDAGLRKAREIDAGLILTCDCGITAVETVRQAEAAGFRVVVTDHHLPGPELPPATAVVDPQQPGDVSGADVLCGTGVAFKLVQALVPALDLPANLPLHLLDYVALATVADVVPLTGENRILVRHGLKLLGDSRWAGLRALVSVAGLHAKEIRAGHCGFVLGPRLNAAGRVGDAGDGLRLLLTDVDAEAQRLAEHLERLNAQRQDLDQRMLEEAIAQVESQGDFGERSALVLAGDRWHAGVVGIVASRIVERYGRPTFLIAFDEDDPELGKGSGRSISRFHLRDALAACGDLLERYGGHRMAAGLTIRRPQLEAFRERFHAVAARDLRPDDLGPEQRVDLEIDLADASDRLEELCRHLEPCGTENPGPVFAARGVRLTDVRVVGKGHLKATLTHGRHRLDGIGFGLAERMPVGEGPVDVAFRLERNEYLGRSSLQARIVTVLPAVPAA